MIQRLDLEPDDRRGGEEEVAPRNRQMVRAVLLCIAVAALAGGSWWAGHSSKPSAPDASAVPEIRADNGPVKEAPANPGGLVVPDQDSVLLNREGKQVPEELLPPPQAVMQRPVAPAPPQPVAPPPAKTANTPPATPPAAAPVSPPSVSSPPPQIAATPAPAPARPAAAPPAAKIAPPVSSATGGGYRLQLGALKTAEAAKQEWLRLQRREPDVLGRLSLTVSRIDLGAKGTYYRIQAGPIADAAAAAQSCAALKSRNIGCILVKP